MEALLLLVILGVVVYVAYLLMSQRAKSAEQSARNAAAAKRPVDPLADWSSSGGDQQFLDLKPGDLVKTDGEYLVRGTIAFNDGGSTWFEHLLDDAAGTKQWLSVENDEGLELGTWRRIPMADVESGSPGDRSVVVRGVAYKLVERGSTGYTSTGTTSTAPTGSAEYIDYEAADGAMLGFERFDGSAWEAALGKKVLPSEVEVFPSAGQGH